MEFREMVYRPKRLSPQQLTKGTYKGLDYYVLNLGTHPCAYIDVTGTSIDGVEYEEVDIECHGGLTYSRPFLATVDKPGWFIGWDYSHYGDFSGTDMMFPPELQFGGKQWTTKEIVVHCFQAIDQMVKNHLV